MNEGSWKPRLKLNILEHLSKILYEAKTKTKTQLDITLSLPASLNMSEYKKTGLGGPDSWTTGTISAPVCPTFTFWSFHSLIYSFLSILE